MVRRHLRRLIGYLWALPNTLLGLIFVPFVFVTKGQVQAIDGVLELQGTLTSFVLRHLVPLRGGASAITLGHVVLARDASALVDTRAHERAHVRQYEAWGPAFIPAYLLASVWALLGRRGAYRGNYFERGAVRQAAKAGGAAGTHVPKG